MPSFGFQSVFCDYCLCVCAGLEGGGGAGDGGIQNITLSEVEV